MSTFAQKSFLGEQLINAGIITREQLEKTLMQQRQRKDTDKGSVLGQLLVENGYCSEEDIARVIAKNTGSYFVTLSSHAVDMSAANLITPEIAEIPSVAHRV